MTSHDKGSTTRRVLPNVDMERLSARLAAAGVDPTEAERVARSIETMIDELRLEFAAEVERTRAEMAVDLARLRADLARDRHAIPVFIAFWMGAVLAFLVIVAPSYMPREPASFLFDPDTPPLIEPPSEPKR